MNVESVLFGCVYMLIKAVDKDTVKILIEHKDIEDFPNFKNLDYNSDSAKKFIFKLLKEIYSQTGINFLDGKVIIEALPGSNDSYYLLVSRIGVSDDKYISKPDGDIYIFKFTDIETIFDIAKMIDSFKKLPISTTQIYKYRDNYYLLVEFPPATVSDSRFYSLVKAICEYAQKCKWNIINEALLKEWGELICPNILLLK